MPSLSSIAIVGVGLIGGSIGMAARARKVAGEIIGIGRNEERLREAVRHGAIDRGTTDLAAGVADAEIVVVCTPVGSIVEHVFAVADACRSDALITDAGSTKAEIVAAIESTSAAAQFVGSHPIAGDHRSGVAHAAADLLTDRTVVVTVTDSTRETTAERASAFWTSLGANVYLMAPDEHDTRLAASSHAPHLVAAALAVATPPDALPFTGGGWRDATRVAAGDPGLWRDIVASNRAPVAIAVREVESTLAKIREAIESGNDEGLEQILKDAKQIRDTS